MSPPSDSLERRREERRPARFESEQPDERPSDPRTGAANIRVFGSVARGTARPGSDIDLLVDYVPGQTGFAFRFCREAEALLGCRVDVATERSLHPMIRDRVREEALPL